LNVLFICVANAGRSVMAERIFDSVARGRHAATSAGSEPRTGTHAVVIEALDEIGLDARDHVPQQLTNELVSAADVVVSTCGEEACPVTPPGTRRVYWDLADPKNRSIDDVRAIRDDIGVRVDQLVRELDTEVA